MDDPSMYDVKRLGKCTIDAMEVLPSIEKGSLVTFAEDSTRVVLDARVRPGDGDRGPAASFEIGGPRRLLYFDPSKLRAGIVTCGGICPGLNNVIRGIVMKLWHRYGVRRIAGVRYGLRGFVPSYRLPLVDLDPERVASIHHVGGSILGSSRGHQDPGAIVDAMDRQDMDVVFFVGGDGTLRAAHLVAQEVERRNVRAAIVGVPKTIDNDIMFVEKSFGLDTAVSIAAETLRAAHAEATGAPSGIVVVKLMGRQSGYIAARAALATQDVNLVLVPEQRFELDGPAGLLALLRRRFERSDHMVVVVAEGAGQDLLGRAGAEERDPSGNLKLGDIGEFLCRRIREAFASWGREITLRYIDPSYIIRAAPAIAADGIYCAELAEMAVHAAMAGRTDMVVGSACGRITHVPLALATSGRKTIDLEGPLWRSVLEATGQPASLVNG